MDLKKLHPHAIHRPREKSLGTLELVAIALGGMVGGGIFTVLGVSVAMVGAWTPVAIILGGLLAALSAYSYIKLGVYYKDEGAAYAFFKKSFPGSHFAASLIGWWIVFGYISTLALYAFTFASYALSGVPGGDAPLWHRLAAGGIIALFTLVNIWSVRGMGKLEDLMVYTKLVILVIISFVLINNGHTTLPTLVASGPHVSLFAILILASLTFVAYEGFELIINAVGEIKKPERQIPIAIYTAIFLAVLIYVVIALGAILAIPFDEIVAKKEYALAAGADMVLGHWGTELVIAGALLATSSAISGTVFGASRQMAAVADDGYLPAPLSRRSGHIPVTAILTMSGCAFALILSGSLELILEFGSVTFLLLSLLMAVANYRVRHLTGASTLLTLTAIGALGAGTGFILYYELTHRIDQMAFILAIYGLLTLGAWQFARRSSRDAIL